MKTPVAILVRVSTNVQDTSRQITELTAHAEANGWEVVATLQEQGVSRRAAQSERHGLTQALHLATTGKIKKVLVHEVSRIGRPAIMHPFIEEIHKHGVSLYWHTQRSETLLPDGSRSQAAGMMLAIMSEMALSEIENLSTRIKSGLEEARRKGVRLGRPKRKTLPEKILAKHEDIIRLLKAGKSYRDVAARTGKAFNTVLKVAGMIGLAGTRTNAPRPRRVAAHA